MAMTHYTTFHSTFYFNKLIKILRCPTLIPKFICEGQCSFLIMGTFYLDGLGFSTVFAIKHLFLMCAHDLENRIHCYFATIKHFKFALINMFPYCKDVTVGTSPPEILDSNLPYL